MARDITRDLIHHIKLGRNGDPNTVYDLSRAYFDIELTFSETDKTYYRQLHEWALLGYSGYNPYIGQLLSRSDAELLKNQAVEAIVRLETAIDSLALMKALDMADNSMMIQDAKYRLNEAIDYAKIIAEKIIFVKGLEQSMMKVKSNMIDEQPEEAALEYLNCLEANEKQFQDHMDFYFAQEDDSAFLGDKSFLDSLDDDDGK